MDWLASLPPEVLLRVAKELPLGDFNALCQVDKYVNGILEANRKRLPQAKGRVHISMDRNGDAVSLRFQNAKFGGTCEQYVVVSKEATGDETLSEVTEFYYANKDKGTANVNFPSAMIGGFDRHLQFLLAKIQPDKLELSFLSADCLKEITRLLREHRSLVFQLVVYSSTFHQCYFDMLSACSVKSLILCDVCQLPQGFLQEPTIRKLEYLVVTVGDVASLPLEDTELLALPIPHIWFRKGSLTLDLLFRFIEQWMDGTRDIVQVAFCLVDPPRRQTELIARLTASEKAILDDVHNYEGGGMEARITRVSDGSSLQYIFRSDAAIMLCKIGNELNEPY